MNVSLKSLSIYTVILITILSSLQLITILIPNFRFIDDILLLILFLLFLFDTIFLEKNYYKSSPRKFILFLIFISLMIFSLSINFFSLESFLYKLLYYIKIFIVFRVISYFSSKYFTYKEKDYIYYFLLLICVISLLEFYFIQYLGNNLGEFIFLKYRDGIYRAASLTGHPISLGMVAFIGIVYNVERNNLNKYTIINSLVFFISLLCSGTRIPLLLLFFYILYKIFLYEFSYRQAIALRNLLFIYTPILLLLILVLFNPQKYFEDKNEILTTRMVSIKHGIELFQDSYILFLGTGIGSYGMSWSVINNSPAYNRIKFPQHYKNILLKAKGSGMESSLFMILFEMGIINFIIYYCFLFGFSNSKSQLEVFFIFVTIIYSLFYPIYTLPFIYLLNLFFPFSRNKNRL
jgi:hypothetical protein